ncbi:MAG: hypothetical protein KDC92_15365, partial [Bacteroidetes bacterium]|nr:hypothetical protein [Bacteroidota bacterium]
MKARPDEKRGLEKVFRFSVIGAAIIVVVYSVYYYSNSYRLMSSKVVVTKGESEMTILPNADYDFTGDRNEIYTPLIGCLKSTMGNHLVKQNAFLPNAICNSKALASNNYSVVSGTEESGVLNDMFDLITQRYGTAPPRQLKERVNDYVVYGVHYQPFILSDHVLVNWKNENTNDYPYNRFAYFVIDSAKKHYHLVNHNAKILRFERPEFADHCYLAEWKSEWSNHNFQQLNTEVLPQLVYSGKRIEQGVVRFPIMDFQWNHEFEFDK